MNRKNVVTNQRAVLAFKLEPGYHGQIYIDMVVMTVLVSCLLIHRCSCSLTVDDNTALCCLWNVSFSSIVFLLSASKLRIVVSICLSLTHENLQLLVQVEDHVGVTCLLCLAHLGCLFFALLVRFFFCRPLEKDSTSRYPQH